MNVKEILSGFGLLLIVGALCLGGALVLASLYYGAAWISTKLLPLFPILSLITFGVVVLIVLPLAVPKATRGFASAALVIASYVFGVTLWMEGLLLTLTIWGLSAVFIGLLLGGVGVVPIAMLATLIDGMWSPLIELVLLMVATVGLRFGGNWLGESLKG